MEEVDSRPDEPETEDESEATREDEDRPDPYSEESNAFKALEEEYVRVLGEMQNVEGMSNFCTEYTRLFEALAKSYENETRLKYEYQELEAEIVANTSKVNVALKLSAADKETIEQLKHEIDSSWKLVDTAHAREQNAHETIENLRQQVQRLNTEIEQKARLDLDQADETGTLSKTKEGVVREKERMMHEIVILRERLANTLTFQEELERKNSAADIRITDLTNELEAQQTETAKELRFKERMETDIKELQSDVTTKDQEMATLITNLHHSQQTATKLEATAKDQKTVIERIQKEIENLTIRSQKVQMEYDAQIVTVEKLIHENNLKATELKIKEDEILKLRSETSKISKIREGYIKKLQQADNARGNFEEEKEKLHTVIVNMERDLDIAKKQADMDKRAIENYGREREILNKNLLKAAGQAQEHVKLLRLQEQVKSKLEQEIEQYMLEASKQRKIISTLERERDRYVTESTELTQKVEDTLDEVKLKQMAIFDYKKKIAEGETKFRQQQNLFEAVRSDRNTFSKHLLEAQDEISELKQKLKVMSHQIEQLKEDITTKETQLLREEFALEKAEKEKENLKLELQQTKDALQESKQKIISMTQEEHKLQKIIQEADETQQRQKKEMEQITNERDILGTQLVRRNDELSLLYEKIKILQSTLHKGEAQYDQRLEDIRLLKLEIKRLRQEKVLLSRSVANMTDLRQEIFHMERDLTRERLKCRALEEELQNPLNIHRWRKLEGSDPKTYELIQKIHLLQKRLLAQSSAAIQRENQLRESERLYLSLRQLLAKQPGPEVSIRLHKTQQALRERGRKMRCLVSELNMYESQVSEYKFDLDRVNQELQDIKNKYYIQKRREQISKQQSQGSTRAQPATGVVLPQVNASKTRFTGGGFNLNAQPTKTQSIGI